MKKNRKLSNKTVVSCTRCTATADISKNPNAWNGWQVLPVEICPDCIEQGMVRNQEAAARKAAQGGALVVIERSSELGRRMSTFSVLEAR